MHKTGSEFLYKNASEKIYYKYFEINDALIHEYEKKWKHKISSCQF
jgi:hypothetical protein